MPGKNFHAEGRPARPEREMVLALLPDANHRFVRHEHINGERSAINGTTCNLGSAISIWGRRSGRRFQIAHDGADLLVWRVK